jgi:hypothetical protein
MKTKPDIYVIFDGTSHFIIPIEDYEEGEVCGTFWTINAAQLCADNLNKLSFSSI